MQEFQELMGTVVAVDAEPIDDVARSIRLTYADGRRVVIGTEIMGSASDPKLFRAVLTASREPSESTWGSVRTNRGSWGSQKKQEG